MLTISFKQLGLHLVLQTRYRLWVTSYNQPALLFSSIVTSLQDPIKNYGPRFPTLLKTLIDDSRLGNAQIDLVNEGAKFASLVMRRIGGNPMPDLNGKRAMPWFGCRLEIADDSRVREHLTTMVLSLRVSYLPPLHPNCSPGAHPHEPVFCWQQSELFFSPPSNSYNFRGNAMKRSENVKPLKRS